MCKMEWTTTTKRWNEQWSAGGRGSWKGRYIIQQVYTTGRPGGTLFSKFTPRASQESCSWGCWGTVQVIHLRAPPLIGVTAPSARSANSFPSGPHRKATWSLNHVFFFGCFVLYVVVQSTCCVWLFTTPWTAARQASLPFTISWSLLRFMSTESVMPSNCLVLVPFSSCPQSFPASGSFPMSQFFASGSQSSGASASASVVPVNIQDWFPLGWTGWISLQSKRLSTVFSKTTVKKHQFFSTQPSLWPSSYIHHDYWKNHSFDYTDLCQESDVSAF